MPARVALVGEDDVAGGRDPFKDLGGGFALVDVSGDQFKSRSASRPGRRPARV
jgi:hypothetical protein